MTHCAMCGAPKRKSKHWWVIAYQHNPLWYQSTPIDNAILGSDDQAVVCGETCLVKAESRIRNGKPLPGRDEYGELTW